MRRLALLSFVAVVLIAANVAAQTNQAAPPSVSCLGPEGESYLRDLLARIHQLEAELDAEKQARLAERTKTDGRLEQKEAELSERATALSERERSSTTELEAAKRELEKLKAANAAFADAEKQRAAQIEAAQREIDKLRSASLKSEDSERELATTQRALQEANEAQRKAEEEAAAAKRAAAHDREALAQFSQRLDEIDRGQRAAEAASRREAEAPAAQQKASPAAALAAEAPSPSAPTRSNAAGRTEASPVSDRDLAAAQLAALSGKSSAPSARSQMTAEPSAGERILPGERIALRVAKMDELNRTVEVSDDGAIDLPLVGVIQAAGRTEPELVADLQERLTAYLKEPRVEVSREHAEKRPAPAAGTPASAPRIVAAEPAVPTPAAAPALTTATPGGGTYSVEGWVSRPGTYPLKGRTSLTAAIAEAGGAAFSARLDEVEIEHPSGGSEARHEVVNFAKIASGGTDVTVHAGDAIRVSGPVFLTFPWAFMRIVTFPFWYPFS